MNMQSDPPPTPAAFAKQVADRYAQAEDPLNPFFRPAEIAVHRLLIQAVFEIFGPNDPFAQFARAYERAYVLSVPVNYSEDKADALEDCLDDMRAAWEVIEQDTFETVEVMRG